MNGIEDPTQDSDYRVPALQRGLWILQLFSSAERVLSMNDIAERLGSACPALYQQQFVVPSVCSPSIDPDQ